jgi:hypothetical protein
MLPALAARMHNHKALKFKATKLFAHQKDEAFELLGRLEGLFARMVSPRGSRFLRERMQRASARLAHIIIVGCDDERPDRVSARYEPAVMLCKIVDGMLRLLSHYSALSAVEIQDALKVTRELMRIVARRYFGFEAVDDDGGSSSPGSSVPPTASAMLPIPGSGFGIAADGPPLRPES